MQLTVNGLTSVDPKADTLTTNLKPGMERQYATYLADVLQHFRDNPMLAEQINFQWISPVNEPQWDWVGGQEGTRNSNADIIRQYRAIAAELAGRQIDTHILGPESGSIPDMYRTDGSASGKHKAPYGDYIRVLTEDSAIAKAMDHCLAYHSYWSDGPQQLIHDREKLRQALDHHPDFRAVCSEYCVMDRGRDLGMDTAIRTMRIVHADLTVVNAVGWSWWTAVSNGNYKDGLIYTDYRRPGDVETVYPSKLLWALGNFSRFVRPGMVRVEIKSIGKPESIDGVMGSAYVDTASGKTVAVYINTTDQPVTLRLGLAKDKSTAWTPYLTSNSPEDDLRAWPIVPAGQAFDLPGKSVVTMVARQ
jgi:O-glycosyl hydrolase